MQLRHHWRQRRQQEKLYGGQKEFGDTDEDPDISLGVGGTLITLAIFLLFFVGLWFYPMIKAFRCPTNGMLWGLLIFFPPPLGLGYLFVGCQDPALADKATTA